MRTFLSAQDSDRHFGPVNICKFISLANLDVVFEMKWLPKKRRWLITFFIGDLFSMVFGMYFFADLVGKSC
jgi:hypothetical protein